MSNCILWEKTKNHQGYGRRKYKGKLEYAHRVAYAEAAGVSLESLQGVVIRHQCDNPSCVNPAHLEPGTKLDNSRDMVERERQGCRKLTWELVRTIRAVYVPRHPECGVRGLGRSLNVSPGLISLVVLNKIWKEGYE